MKMGGISTIEFAMDAEGNKYLNFDEESRYNDNSTGQRLTDYEILHLLTDEESQNFVAKVRSLKDNQIYAMKRIDLTKSENSNINQYIDQVMNQLKGLNNPHILKYYNHFSDNMNLYIIMEYMNNSDIISFIQAHKILNDEISEEEIWNILLQCLSALDYLHSQNYENLGLKLTNIFMNNEQNIKISVFHEVMDKKGNVNPREDIDMLGKYFFILLNPKIYDDFTKSKKNLSNLEYEKSDNENNYSNELKEIVNSMSVHYKPNIEIRTLYNTVKYQYVKKYAKNTSIEAVIRCLASYKKLNDEMGSKRKEFEDNREKNYINYWLCRAIDAISGFIEEKELNSCIEEFRRAIASSYSKLDGNKEIDPLLLLTYLLVMMHKERNNVEEENKNNIQKQNMQSVISSRFIGDEEDKTKKEQVWNNFINNYNSQVHSPISDLFFGFVKRKRICQTCRTGYYSFYNYLYITFDLSDREDSQKFDLIEDGFRQKHNNYRLIEEDSPDKMICDRCAAIQRCKEFNRYYMLKDQLIICFIRGTNYKNKSKIEFNEFINLKDYIEPEILSPQYFYLTGSIIRSSKNDKEKFVSYSRDPYNEYAWHLTHTYVDVPNKENKHYCPLEDIKREEENGQIMMLFYNRTEKMGK